MLRETQSIKYSTRIAICLNAIQLIATFKCVSDGFCLFSDKHQLNWLYSTLLHFKYKLIYLFFPVQSDLRERKALSDSRQDLHNIE